MRRRCPSTRDDGGAAVAQLLDLLIVQEREDQRLKFCVLCQILAQEVQEQLEVLGVRVLLQRLVQDHNPGMEPIQGDARRREGEGVSRPPVVQGRFRSRMIEPTMPR